MNEKIGIIGGGPAALLIFKRLMAAKENRPRVSIFEAGAHLGSGMPYSENGSRIEHVTNVSSDELPKLSSPLVEWIKTIPQVELAKYGIDADEFHEKEVVSRLLFGQYLRDQFETLLAAGKKNGSEIKVNCGTKVVDLVKNPDGSVTVVTDRGLREQFDRVIICTGHHWVHVHEGKVPGYFDSPYPPSKLALHFDHEVTIRGSSLTAIDAIKTVALSNGSFHWEGEKFVYKVSEHSPNFKIALHSKHGLLPCVRVHFDEPHIGGSSIIEPSDIENNIRSNDGFLELDFLFNKGFKEPLRDSDMDFFNLIADMDLESFVEAMMSKREAMEPFALFRKEYEEAGKSIEGERPIYWKEMLAALSFAMNFPAKHFSAEDMLRLQKHLMPLISVVIAFVPQGSCETLLALHDAGRLTLTADGDGGSVEVDEQGQIVYSWADESGTVQSQICKTFIDCVGQRHLLVDDFPFKSLIEQGAVSGARLKFKSAEAAKEAMKDKDLKIDSEPNGYFMRVPGVNITDNFEIVNAQGVPDPRIFLMAVPHMGGFNPDYSGLDFCERASELIANRIFKNGEVTLPPVN